VNIATVCKKNGVLSQLCDWFDVYAQSFMQGCSGCAPLTDTPCAQLINAVKLKYDHTIRVCEEMALLCDSVNLCERLRSGAVTAALFHDVGRFEQFRLYGTFSDKRSFDHAAMAIEIIDRHNLFSSFVDRDAVAVKEAIRYHNAISIPAELSEDGALLCRLVRDADKLDIYRIALEYYAQPKESRQKTFGAGLDEGHSVTPGVCERVLERKIVPYEMVKTMYDFKMIQAGWVFDLNFTHSLRCVRERGYISAIRKMLDPTPEVTAILDSIERYIEERLRT